MKYAFALSTLTAGILCALIGLLAGVGSEPKTFARFGALVILCGVAAEYSLVKIEMSNLYVTVRERSGVWNDDHWGLEVSQLHTRLSWCAHVLVVGGTLISGFGDLLLE